MELERNNGCPTGIPTNASHKGMSGEENFQQIYRSWFRNFKFDLIEHIRGNRIAAAQQGFSTNASHTGMSGEENFPNRFTEVVSKFQI